MKQILIIYKNVFKIGLYLKNFFMKILINNMNKSLNEFNNVNIGIIKLISKSLIKKIKFK